MCVKATVLSSKGVRKRMVVGTPYCRQRRSQAVALVQKQACPLTQWCYKHYIMVIHTLYNHRPNEYSVVHLKDPCTRIHKKTLAQQEIELEPKHQSGLVITVLAKEATLAPGLPDACDIFDAWLSRTQIWIADINEKHRLPAGDLAWLLFVTH